MGDSEHKENDAKLYNGQGQPDITRAGDWVQTYSGHKFWPLDPHPEEIHLVDIAHQLSLKCRFNGAVRELYSVAEHSVRVSYVVETLGGGVDDQLCAMFHDAGETWLPDVPRPIKRGGGNLGPMLQEVEKQVLRQVARRFDLPWPFSPTIKQADNIMLATEARDLMDQKIIHEWYLPEEPIVDEIVPMTSTDAEDWFLARYDALMSRRNK